MVNKGVICLILVQKRRELVNARSAPLTAVLRENLPHGLVNVFIADGGTLIFEFVHLELQITLRILDPGPGVPVTGLSAVFIQISPLADKQ